MVFYHFDHSSFQSIFVSSQVLYSWLNWGCLESIFKLSGFYWQTEVISSIDSTAVFSLKTFRIVMWKWCIKTNSRYQWLKTAFIVCSWLCRVGCVAVLQIMGQVQACSRFQHPSWKSTSQRDPFLMVKGRWMKAMLNQAYSPTFIRWNKSHDWANQQGEDTFWGGQGHLLNTVPYLFGEV